MAGKSCRGTERKVASALRNWTCKQAELVSEDGPTL